jgi:putative spermidine/putrescine transport system substrate-binding protein
VLRVLAWPGYAEPEVVQAFERAHGAKVSVTVVGSDDDPLAARVRQWRG